jgi:hypothetical protein
LLGYFCASALPPKQAIASAVAQAAVRNICIMLAPKKYNKIK